MALAEKDYPYIYLDSDAASKGAQKRYKIISWSILCVMLICTIIGCLPEGITKDYFYIVKINGYLLLGTAIASTLLFFLEPEKNWYIGRAVSESVKTLSWRYIMRSEPFNIIDEALARRNFIERIGDIITEVNKDGFTPKKNERHSDIITQRMENLRKLDFTSRKKEYEVFRIEDQIDWYSKKVISNRNYARLFSSLIIIFQFVAAVYLIFFIDTYKELKLTEIMIFIATSLIAILEMNKYKELHQSYFVTQSELNIIKSKFNTVTDDSELDEFVKEAEQAISREHTMWLARRGNSAYLNY